MYMLPPPEVHQLSKSGFDKTQPMQEPNLVATGSCKYGFIGTHPRPLIYILSKAVFKFQRQSRVIPTRTTPPAEPEILTACSLQKCLLMPGLYQHISWCLFNICPDSFGLPGTELWKRQRISGTRALTYESQNRDERLALPCTSPTALAADSFSLNLGFPPVKGKN